MTSDEHARDMAIERIKARKGFQAHLVSYLVINAAFWVMWAVTGRDGGGVPWPLWITVFWGLGLAMHGWSVYGDKGITEAEVQREMERNKGTIDPGHT